MGSDFWQINQKSQQTPPLEQPLRPMSRSSRLGLSDLRNEQATILGEMEDRVFSPSLRDRARAASVAAEAVYSAKKRPGGGGSLDTPVGVAAIQARTNALSAELEFHQDLLNQLLTPPGKQSSKSVEPLQTSTLRNEQQHNTTHHQNQHENQCKHLLFPLNNIIELLDNYISYHHHALSKQYRSNQSHEQLLVFVLREK